MYPLEWEKIDFIEINGNEAMTLPAQVLVYSLQPWEGVWPDKNKLIVLGQGKTL